MKLPDISGFNSLWRPLAVLLSFHPLFMQPKKALFYHVYISYQVFHNILGNHSLSLISLALSCSFLSVFLSLHLTHKHLSRTNHLLNTRRHVGPIYVVIVVLQSFSRSHSASFCSSQLHLLSGREPTLLSFE